MTNRFTELTQEIQDRIREIAYLMWESAGRQHGMAMQYWLTAEQEVLATFQAAAHRFLPETAMTSTAAAESQVIAAAENQAVEAMPDITPSGAPMPTPPDINESLAIAPEASATGEKIVPRPRSRAKAKA